MIEPPSDFEPLEVWLEFRRAIEKLPPDDLGAQDALRLADETIARKRGLKGKLKPQRRGH